MGEAKAKTEVRSGKVLQVPWEKATTQRNYSTGSPSSPLLLLPRPLQAQPGDARASLEKYSCTHKDSHQQRHVPPQPFPGERWASGIPIVATHSASVPSLKVVGLRRRRRRRRCRTAHQRFSCCGSERDFRTPDSSPVLSPCCASQGLTFFLYTPLDLASRIPLTLRLTPYSHSFTDSTPRRLQG